MSDVKWIKLTASMFDDEKIKLIESMPDADSILVIWIKLLIQAGKTNANGYIFLNENIPYTVEMLSTIFNRPLNTVRLAFNTFKDFNMISMDDDGIYIENWSKHQNIEGLNKLKEKRLKNRLRQEKYRKKQKLLKEGKTGNVSITLSNGTELELELEEDKELDKESNIKPSDKSDNHCDEFSITKKENGYYDYPEEFETLYSIYPKNKGTKKAGWRKWAARRREGVDQELLLISVKNYATGCQKENRGMKYVQHLSTFLGPDEHWKGYLKGGQNEFSGDRGGKEKEDEGESIFNE